MDTSNGDETSIQLMVSMGFDRELSRHALSLAAGNVDRAIDNILSGQASENTHHAGGGGGDGTATVSDRNGNGDGTLQPNRIVGADISQYSLPGGRSACTAIALHTVSTVLQKIAAQSDANGNTNADANTDSNTSACADLNFITPAQLGSFVVDGVELYNRLRGTNDHNHNPSIEHSSAEELLSMIPNDLNLGLRIIGGVRQGILTTNKGGENNQNAHPLGLNQILRGCRLDSDADDAKWMGIVITKTPETICIFLPPVKNSTTSSESSKSSERTSTQSNEYIIVDSHPRPPQEGCHAIFHSSIEGVLNNLQDVFVAVDLGSDVPEMMAMMYNSFDVYAFQKYST